MVKQERHEVIDLKAYQPFGIPIIKLMAGIAVFALLATALYEYTL